MPEHPFQIPELPFQMPELPFQMPELPFQMPELTFQMPELPFKMPVELPLQMAELRTPSYRTFTNGKHSRNVIFFL
jgi:hypothetical protein